MALKEKLNEIKNETEALLDYANDVTGESDIRLGDAILTLANGFGGGGGTPWELAHDITIAEDTHEFTVQIDSANEVAIVFSTVVTEAQQIFVFQNTVQSTNYAIGNIPYAAAGQRWGVMYLGSGDYLGLPVPDNGHALGINLYGSTTKGASADIPEFPPKDMTAGLIRRTTISYGQPPFTRLRITIGGTTSSFKAGSRFQIYVR